MEGSATTTARPPKTAANPAASNPADNEPEYGEHHGVLQSGRAPPADCAHPSAPGTEGAAGTSGGLAGGALLNQLLAGLGTGEPRRQLWAHPDQVARIRRQPAFREPAAVRRLDRLAAHG
jgi:hypothetical protein